MIDNEGFKISDQGKPHFVINYDKNGNIKSLDRKGHIVQNPFQENSGDFGLMDRLEYGYDSGNKLLNVSDTGTTETGFKDGNITQSTSESLRDYVYDENGNMTVDRNKGIESIEYNHLNLPTSITINGNGNIGTIQYVYDATGVKLQKHTSGTDNGNTVNTTTQYAGNHIYENGELQFFNHAEGYVTPNGANGYDYVYQYKDHLGNVRLSFTNDPSNSGTPTIIEESNYYPFGLKMRGFNGGGDTSLGNDVAQRWKFGDKELDETFGMATYDFGARNYDSSIGRWFVVDPKADDILQVDLTPYNYSWNNPITFNDPDGKCPWCWGAVIGFGVEYGAQVVTNLVNGKSLGDALTDVDGGKLLIATATGAATGGLSSIKVIGTTAKVYKAIAVSSTAAGGNIIKQGLMDGNKTVDPIEMATEAVLEGIPVPKIEIPNVKKETIKTAQRQADRAERVAGENPRPSREQAMKETKENVENLEKKKENIETANKVLNQTKDAIIKEQTKSGLQKGFENFQFQIKQ